MVRRKMSIDFSKLLEDDEARVVNPRDVFFTLDRDSGFSFPRDIQTEVMNRWFNVRNNSDNIIKLNVGSGKTLVGLLLLQSSLNEGIGPALYLAPNKQLVDQVVSEAKKLGINITEDPWNPEYLAGESICIVNIYKLFNGHSVFGVDSVKIDIGTVVVDDAHACQSIVAEQFRIHIESDDQIYAEILAKFSEDLKGYNEALFMEVSERDPSAYMEVPFWSWAAHRSDVLEILFRHRKDEALTFKYPLLKSVLPHCRCVIGGKNLEIEPHFPTSDIIPSFRRASRRIYLTATLFDDSAVVTHFGANMNRVQQPIVPLSSQSVGERMILMPQELNPDLTRAEIQVLLSRLAEIVNVVVIVPSGVVAESWRCVADEVLQGDQVTRRVHELRDGHLGMSVFINRYDGIDLPDDACRVLVIDGLPEVSSYIDRLDSQVLGNSNINLRRQIERIEQGMGRGVRSNDDHCVVLLLGPKLIARIRSKDGYQMLTPATKAQVDLSRTIAKHLHQPSITEVEDVIRQSLNRDPAWIKVNKTNLLNLRSDDMLRIDTKNIALYGAFQYARSNQYDDAVKTIRDSIFGSDEPPVKAWLLSRMATYQHAIDAQNAQRTLLKAHNYDTNVLCPLIGIGYQKISNVEIKQAELIITRHESSFDEPVDIVLFAEDLCSDLRFSTVESDVFEEAIDRLAWFLGFSSQRPDKRYRVGPDNLWRLSSGISLIIECKNRVTSSGGIAKRDLGQLSQSVEWFKATYPSSTCIPVLIHPQHTLRSDARPIPDMRVIDSECLEELRRDIKGLSRQFSNPDTAGSISAIAKRLKQFRLNSEGLVGRFLKVAE